MACCIHRTPSRWPLSCPCSSNAPHMCDGPRQSNTAVQGNMVDCRPWREASHRPFAGRQDSRSQDATETRRNHGVAGTTTPHRIAAAHRMAATCSIAAAACGIAAASPQPVGLPQPSGSPHPMASTKPWHRRSSHAAVQLRVTGEWRLAISGTRSCTTHRTAAAHVIAAAHVRGTGEWWLAFSGARSCRGHVRAMRADAHKRRLR